MKVRIRKEYDFSKAKPNPYVKKLRKQISIRLDVDTRRNRNRISKFD